MLKKIYIAGPLFTLAEKEFNVRFAEALLSRMNDIEIILPQDRAKQFINKQDGLQLIFKDCLKMVKESDIIIGILDGPDADSGTSAELGYAYALKKPIIGVRTDFRISEDRGLNLMLSNICNDLIIDVNSSLEELTDAVIKSIKNVSDAS